MAEWCARPLDAVYPVIFIDALVVKIRGGAGHQPADLGGRRCHGGGVTVNGDRDILGWWAGDGGEGAKFWLAVLTDLKNRGVTEVCMVVCDGLRGLPESITTTWSFAQVQTSSIDTGRWRDGLAGHRATGRGPMQTRAFEALMQTCPSWWRRVA